MIPPYKRRNPKNGLSFPEWCLLALAGEPGAEIVNDCFAAWAAGHDPYGSPFFGNNAHGTA